MLNYIKKRMQSFGYALKGIIDLFSHHPNAQIHLFLTTIVVILSFYLELSPVEWCIIIFCIIIVLALEAINSAIEYLADRITKEQDPLIGKAKDIAAAAVLLGAIGTCLIGLIIIVPKLSLIWGAK